MIHYACRRILCKGNKKNRNNAILRAQNFRILDFLIFDFPHAVHFAETYLRDYVSLRLNHKEKSSLPMKVAKSQVASRKMLFSK